jgi:hypothetical protein
MLAIFGTLVPLTSIIKFVAREQSRRWDCNVDKLSPGK